MRKIPPDELQAILGKVDRGLSYCKIAREHNLHFASVSRIALRHGIRTGHKGDRIERRLLANLESIKSQLASGVMLKEISARMEVSTNTLRSFLQKQGVLKPRKRGRKVENVWEDEIKGLQLAGLARDYFHRPLNERLLAA